LCEEKVKDVTQIFETYRECARHLRNTYFSTRDNEVWDIIEDFEKVARVLFERLVLVQLVEERFCDGKFEPEIGSMIKGITIMIAPSSTGMPVMISRDNSRGGNKYWDHPITQLETDDVEIVFREYFDWDQFGLIDFRYYLGTIVSSSKYPEIIGHQVLVETIYAKVMHDERPTTA
jgi:hypothetical protein